MSEISSKLLLLKEKAESLLASRHKGVRFDWPKEFKDEILNAIQEGVKTGPTPLQYAKQIRS